MKAYSYKRFLAIILALAWTATTQAQIASAAAQFILGPQLPIGNTWFDQTQVTRGRFHADAFPALPPSPEQLDAYILNHYYDLGLTVYELHARTNDPADLARARKVCDSWWLSPYIKGGTVRNFDSGGPAPRHAGVGGLILRALDGRPEMFDWINAYTRYHFDHWLKKRINDPALFYGLREGAFLLHYATWLAKAHPDATVRAQYLADVEAVAVSYFGRLQKDDGSWRWDDFDYRDADGGTLKGITQPFMVGLLLAALVDVHQLTTNPTVKGNVANQILKSCRNLYEGTYRKDEPVAGWAGKFWRSFWYFKYGGTTINPLKYQNGGGSYVDVKEGQWVVKSERQGIGPIIASFAYAYLISKDEFYKTAYLELWDAAYGGSDGIRNEFDGTAKNYNQNARRSPSALAWMAQATVPPVTPTPTPIPIPIPTRPVIEWVRFNVANESHLENLMKTLGEQGYSSCVMGPSGKAIYCSRVKQ